MTEGGDVQRKERAQAPPERHLIVRREGTGFESPYSFSHSDGELLTVFSTREAARMYLPRLGIASMSSR